MSDVIRLTRAAHCSEAEARQMLPLVYQKLRPLATHKMAIQPLQTTELVHEAWIKLAKDEEAQISGRTHFFAVATESMRHILIDSTRRKMSRGEE